MKFIGITGGVGAGKSEILAYIRKHYRCEIYLADQVAHEVKMPGTTCFEQLLEILGAEVLNEEGSIDSGRMAEKIFADQSLLQQINGVIHPAVKEYLLDKLQKASEKEEVELFFVEAALLIETGYKALVDEMWYIYAREDIRRTRLMNNRGYSTEKIEQIMSKQLSEQQFREACDFVIDNSGELTESYRQIDNKLEAFTWQA